MAGPDPDWVPILLDCWRAGQQRSMVGPGDVRVHLTLAEQLTGLVEPPDRALDLGSGAGIPGLALAGLWPDSSWVLVDAAQRRVRLLEETVDRLGWGGRIEIVHGRAEELGHRPELREAFALVTSRSFGPPAAAAECGGAFVKLGGTLLVTEPPTADPSRWEAEGLVALGLTALPGPPSVKLLTRSSPLDPRYPRRVGVPAKRPLF